LNESHGPIIDTELLCHQGHECRKMSLSHCLNAGTQCYHAIRLEPQVDGFVENTARYFEKAADTNATYFSVPLPDLAARGKSLRLCERLRLFQSLCEFAAVVARTVRRFVRHRRSRNEISQTQLRRINIPRFLRLIDQALNHVDRLRPARPAIGPQWHRIG